MNGNPLNLTERKTMAESLADALLRELKGLPAEGWFTRYPIKKIEFSGDPFVKVRCFDPQYTVIVMSNHQARVATDQMKRALASCVDDAAEREYRPMRPPTMKLTIAPIE